MVVKMDQASLDWIDLLGKELDRRTTGENRLNGDRVTLGYTRCDDYYSGRQGQRFIATGYRELFTTVFQNYRENVCQVVVDTLEQRLDIDGFKFPSVVGDNPAATDPGSWQVWQDNNLDARSLMAHNEALVKGVAYVLVSPFDGDRVGPGKRSPRITIERPEEAIVATAPGGIDRLVGMKRWRDEVAKRTFITLYFPDRIEKFQGAVRQWANQFGSGLTELDSWERRAVDGESWPLEHGLGVVPLIPLVNRPRLGAGLFAGIEGESEIAQIMSIQDSINFIALNGIIASDKAAFPQKWATGVEIPTDPKTGKPANWQPDIDSILSTTVPDAKFGTFDPVKVESYNGTLAEKLQLVAAISQIPLGNFIQQSGQPQSGDAREAAEVGLTKKADRRQKHFGEGWEEAMRVAARQLGDETRADDTACEAKWKSAAIEATAAKVDALVKLRQTLEVPLDPLWERAGFSATERASFPDQMALEAELQAKLAAATTTNEGGTKPGDDPAVVAAGEPGTPPAIAA